LDLHIGLGSINDLPVSWEFWVTSIVVTATPGTGALFTVAAGLSGDARTGLIAALGCTLGIVPHLLLALSGAATVIMALLVVFEAIKWLGVVYLLYLAWGTWRQAGIPAQTSHDQTRMPRRVIADAILVNLLM